MLTTLPSNNKSNEQLKKKKVLSGWGNISQACNNYLHFVLDNEICVASLTGESMFVKRQTIIHLPGFDHTEGKDLS